MLLRILRGIIRNIKSLLIFFGLLVPSQLIVAQHLTSACNSSVAKGSICYYVVDSGYGVKEGTYQPPPAANGRKTYRKDWTNAGTYTQCATSGGQCVAGTSYTVTVYDAVGPVTITAITPSSFSFCSGQYSATSYTATAANASNYQWTLSPSNAGTISGGTIYWASNFYGNAVLTVTASNQGTGSPSTSASKTITRTQSLTFQGYLSITPDNPCEGDQIAFVASGNAQATFQWFIDDDNTPVSTSSTFYTSNLHFGQVVKVKITPLPSVPCLNSYSTVTKSSNQVVNFSVKEPVHALVLNSPITARCQGSGTTQFTASAISADSYTWSFTPSTAGTISPSTSNATVTWDPQFQGNASISVVANGCRSSQVTAGQTITVNKLPTAYTLAGPSSLCYSQEATIQLSGSEAGVDYQLFKDFEGAWQAKGSAAQSTSWQLPDPNSGSPGLYRVSASKVGCTTVYSNNLNISLIPKQPIVLSGSSNAIPISSGFTTCQGSLVHVYASGGSNYKWYLDLQNTPGCTMVTNPNDRVCWAQLPECTTGDCAFVTQVNSPYPYYVVANDNVCGELNKSANFKFTLVPVLAIQELKADEETLCQGQGTSTFTIKSTGSLLDYDWVVTPQNAIDSIQELSSQQALISWNPNFSGDAEVKYDAEGCQGPVPITKQITIYKTYEDNENLVRTYVAQQPLQRTIDLVTNMLDPNKVSLSNNYFDGLGRNVQNVSTKGSPTQKDIVEVKAYDDYGRENIKYLPFTQTQSLNYRSQPFPAQAAFYASGSNTVAQDASPVSVTQYEPSPLGRPLKQGAPGATWQPADNDPYNQSDHTVKMVYRFNGSNDVVWFTYDKNTGTVSATANNAVRYYPQNVLAANETIDEQGNSIIEYTDKEGRMLCKKVQYAETGGVKQYASTYYIFDDLDNLVMVLPPEAVNSALNQITGN